MIRSVLMADQRDRVAARGHEFFREGMTIELFELHIVMRDRRLC